MSDRSIVAAEGRLALSMKDYKEVLKRPLLALPPEVRPAALQAWTFFKHLKGLETALPIAAWFSVWIDRFGLRIDDANEILGKMLHPGRCQSFQFANDLQTALASEVNQTLGRREREADTKRIREIEKARESEAVPPEEWESLKAKFAGIGNIPADARPAPDHRRNAAFLEAVAEQEARRAGA